MDDKDEQRMREIMPLATRCAERDDLKRSAEEIARLILSQAKFEVIGGKERIIIDQALAAQLPCPYGE